MIDLLKDLGKPIKVSGVDYYDCCGKEKTYNDRHKKCQRCRNAGKYANIKERGIGSGNYTRVA